ncbi:MAG TPA: glycerophosphodiester phosphodiesterase [Pyrinomonadaceae bacterium]|nr:glycerophosphodiester phosphodiesterase [Pyrinomonadaceae bacterium]
MKAALVGVVVAAGLLYAAARWSEGGRAPVREFFRREARRPLVIAHRGGAGLWPENTIYAFERASELGVDVLELDVRASADGQLVVIHDERVERTTDGAGAVSALTLNELKRLDAGFRWTPDGGRTFPLRGQGLTVPTLAEVFERFPHARFNIEPKQQTPSVVAPLCRLLRERGMTASVLVASFRAAVMDEFRSTCTEVATSASTGEATRFLALYKTGLGDSFSPSMSALQVPEYAGGVQVLTRGFVEAAHRRGLEVHAWTINDAGDMRRLLDVGVDGIITDYPDRLLQLLGRRQTP